MGSELTAREATKQIRLRQWQQIISERQGSGLTVEEYCKRNGLTKDKYFYWLSKSKEAMIENNPTVFAELSPTPVTGETFSSLSPITLHLNGVNIDLNGAFDEDMLTSVIRAVRNA